MTKLQDLPRIWREAADLMARIETDSSRASAVTLRQCASQLEESFSFFGLAPYGANDLVFHPTAESGRDLAASIEVLNRTVKR